MVMSKQRKVLRVFLLVSVLVSLCLYWDIANGDVVRHSGFFHQIIKDTKYVLLWKDIWGYKFGSANKAFINAGCRIHDCFITRNASFIPHKDFDAILIHPSTQSIPYNFKNRRPDQVFIMFVNEPPSHVPQNMKVFDNYFNWTITYRTGSTFHLKYGEIIPLDSAPSTPNEAMAMRQEMMRSGINPAHGKTKLAVWMVTNCNAGSNRQTYVKMLKKYVTIDIFSKGRACGGRDVCPRDKNRSVCYRLVEKTYKFYLSFENSICEEYVTEKFFEMMNRNIVPVVLGGANYAAIAPPHSYINALDYTPRRLAEYLNVLDRNDTLYAEYFWWKKHYRVNDLYETSKRVFCDLCEALHTMPLRQSTVTGLQKWYMDPALCRHMPKFRDY